MRAVARTKPAAEVPGIRERDAAQVRAGTGHDEPLRLDTAILVFFRVAHRRHYRVVLAGERNLVSWPPLHKHGFSSPLGHEILTHLDLSKVYVRATRREHALLGPPPPHQLHHPVPDEQRAQSHEARGAEVHKGLAVGVPNGKPRVHEIDHPLVVGGRGPRHVLSQVDVPKVVGRERSHLNDGRLRLGRLPLLKSGGSVRIGAGHQLSIWVGLAREYRLPHVVVLVEGVLAEAKPIVRVLVRLAEVHGDLYLVVPLRFTSCRTRFRVYLMFDPFLVRW